MKTHGASMHGSIDSAAFIPERLRSARELRGWTRTHLARLSGVSPSAISKFERDTAAPSDDTLRTMAVQLGLPVTYLLRDAETLAEVPADQVFYRRRSKIAKWQRRQVEQISSLRQEAIGALVARLDLRPVQPTLPDLSGLPPADAAVELRRQLGMTRGGPVANMVAVLESFGVLVHVLQDDLGKGIDAFSYFIDGQAVVVQNRAIADAYRWRFNSAHELKHLVCDHTVDEGNRQQERDADAFAAEFLVPLRTWRKVAPRSTDPRAYLEQSEIWKVSVGCLLRRNFDAGILNDSRYRYAMMRYSKLGWRTGEPTRPSDHEEHPALIVDLFRVVQRRGYSIDDIGRATGLGTGVLRELFEYELDTLDRERGRLRYRTQGWSADERLLAAEPAQVLQFRR